MTTRLRYGTWPSPLGADALTSGSVRLGMVEVDGESIWWTEGGPHTEGRTVPVRNTASEGPVMMLGDPWSVRTRLHEYGGRSLWLGAGFAVFVNESDQRLYRFSAASAPLALTPVPDTPAGLRYADGAIDPEGRWTVCIREDHDTPPAGEEPANELVVVALDGSMTVEVVASGADFYSEPRISPDGQWLSWIQWDHPNMPWDATELWVAPIAGPDGSVGTPRLVASGVNPLAGGVDGESLHGADWTADGGLVFSADRSGRWNLHRWTPEEEATTPITSFEGSEIGVPLWVVGSRRWAELSDGRLMAVVTTDAVDGLVVIDPDTAAVTDVATAEHNTFSSRVVSNGDGLVAVASGPTRFPGVVVVSPDGDPTTLRPPVDLGIDPSWFSQPESITFSVGGSGESVSHAFFYPPTGDGVGGSEGELPPLIVVGHGGPTGHSSADLNLKIQYWTTRGFAVVDVNYRGSTGFGRAYRDLLRGQWGEYDVADCIAAARHLAETGRVDPDRMAIRGSSAGGLTVMLALIRTDLFSAGTSLYGVADLMALVAETHKFEARYLDSMVGPLPEAAEIYHQRSPINHPDGLTTPMLVMQGLEDKVVPPSQSEAVVAALAANGVDHTYLTFPDEGHGFRQADNLVASLQAELDFYHQVFDLA